MVADDQVIVLGGGSDPPAPPELPKPRRPFLLLVPVALIVGLALALVLIPQTEPEVVSTPDGLEAPPDPPTAFVSSTTQPSDPAEPFQFGARRTDLHGAGVVFSIAHGPDGWLAVTGGSGAVVAHVSENAVLWRPSTVTGMVGGWPIGAVGDGVVAIVASSHTLEAGRAFQIGAVSNDRGESWSAIRHEGRIVVRDVTVLDDEIYVAGSVGEVNGFGWGGPRTAALWTVDVEGERLVPVPLTDVGEESDANAVVDTAQGPMVYGIVDGSPARWFVDGRALPVETPDSVIGLGFAAVQPTRTGLLALVGRSRDEGGSHLWESVDGVEWTESERHSLRSPTTDVALTDDGQLYGTLSDASRVLVGDHGILGVDSFGGASDTASLWFTSVVSADGVSVFGGVVGTEPTLYVEGTTVHPVEVVPSMSVDEPRWRTELTIDLGIQGLSSGETWPLGSAALGDFSYVVTTSNLFEVDTSSGVIVQPLIESPTAFGMLGEDEMWVASRNSTPGGSRIDILSPSDVFRSVDVPLTDVFGVADGNVGLVVTGWNGAGLSALRRTESGDWDTINDPASEEHVFFPAGDGYVRSGVWISDTEQPGAFFSLDLETWEPIDGWRLDEIWGAASLRSVDDPTLVAFAESLPEIDPVRVPATDGEFRVWRWGDWLAVQDPWSVSVRSGDDPWTTLPVDVEHGVTGTPLFVPGDRPRLAMFDDGLLIFMVWR